MIIWITLAMDISTRVWMAGVVSHHRDRMLIAIAAFIVSPRPAMTRAASTSSSTDWPMFGYDAGNSRDNPLETTLSNRS